jgi:hypothetical protein
MSISSEITRITNAKTAIATAISAKGVTVPGGAKIEDMPALIDDISGGGNYQSKSVTYTSNGTATVTPDAGYDALSEVSVTVDVSGGGGGTLKGLWLTYSSYNMELSNIVIEEVTFDNCSIYLSGNAVLKMCSFTGYCDVWCSQSIYDSIFDPLNFNYVSEYSQFNIM